MVKRCQCAIKSSGYCYLFFIKYSELINYVYKYVSRIFAKLASKNKCSTRFSLCYLLAKPVKDTCFSIKPFKRRFNMQVKTPYLCHWAATSMVGGGVTHFSFDVNNNCATNFSYPNAISASLNARSSIKHQEALHG